ncbi:hypothetical protein N7448_009141 [Penicillium atrosanguineum]|uniref:Kinesin-like protein n=1 Tax=Penicillium atrosanguineum TaxID=1132637 RepID=A0A9W9GKH2_9EURO|nr:hypothetical protein N7448_009141 [Penicillium atrosanguineum]KAJ5321466.1 hypothetical protein N7476_004468 [Penicillium atrosanguineum]
MMEEFLLQHADRHQHLIRQFKPKPRPNEGDPVTSPKITVATRIRPLLDEETASGQVPAAFARVGESGVVDLHELRRVVRGPPPLNSSSFRVGEVFGPDRNTESIYEDLVQPLLPWVWEGHIGTLFAYGQTGSGKTYSVNGIERLIAGALFDGTLEGQRRLHVSIFELAGNSAFDLLNTRAPFSILEDSFGNTQLAGAKEHEVTSTPDLLALIEESALFRQTASTEKNDGSSRTHAICRIRVQNPTQNTLDDGVFYLVDLAGSEAARDIFNHSADRMKETREINISLSILKDCIRGLANMDNSKSSKKPYIPFRQSTLTKVLKHVFDPSGNHECRTAVLACIGPSFLDTGATKNTLRYAEMLRSAEMKVVSSGYNPGVPSTWNNKELRNYIKIQSGNPSVSPSVLAPSETGEQLLRLSSSQFISRCLRSDGVSSDQAKAFHAKFWRLHIDSQRNSSGKTSTAKKNVQTLCKDSPSERYSSSRDPALEGKTTVPDFKERIRPGMVISWTCHSPSISPSDPLKQNLALVLCPQIADAAQAQAFLGFLGDKARQVSQRGQRYLCATVSSGALADTYEVNMWRQVVVDVKDMEAEVLLEYDAATRYHHITV